MKRILILIGLLCAVNFHSSAGLTLDYCLQQAKDNYPIIKKYGLIEKCKELNLQEINRGWLPHIGLSVQGNIQNIVPAFPDILQNMLAQNNFEFKGMSKLQYKIAAEINQTIWDGGASKANRAIQRVAAEENLAALDVEMYAIRGQVESLFFGILLIDEQIKQTQSTLSVLDANLTRLQSMVRNGTAMQSDADMVEAQILSIKQNLSEANSAKKGYIDLLSIYINEEIGNHEIECPDPRMPKSLESARPELTLFDKRRELYFTQENAINASLMPVVSFFTQAYYGYPGYNYFESMSKRTPSFNIMAGVKVAWNIESFYTKNIRRRQLSLNSEMVDTDQDKFIYNSRLQVSRDEASIDGIREIMKEDARIVELRQNVRRSAESQLENGIIDATALLSKINDENQALLNSAYHKIQLIQNIYQLKNTLNR